jgi:peptide methionine sulfoxide reductase msrA/msrB
MRSRHALIILCGAWVMGSQSPTSAGSDALFAEAREQLAAERQDSDAAVILSEALSQAVSAAPARRATTLQEALDLAEEARRFTIRRESPLPEGWPKPSLPGLIRIKAYPRVRSAWVRSSDGENRRFRALFRHIKERKIAMTAPVIMAYGVQGTEDAEAPTRTIGMAFLYRRPDQDAAGTFGSVVVVNEEPLTVVSVGVKGAYTGRSLRRALADLHAWLDAHPGWRAAGPARVLGYNSPFMPFWMKYREIQIPVKPKQKPDRPAAMPPLTPEERRIILKKGTERPFTGRYWNTFEAGTYVCRQCGAALYRSETKFRSDCGWPSFDAEIPGAVKRQPDADGRRTEIICAACAGHLGHVFEGEGLTPKNVRHCVNSASLLFRPAETATSKPTTTRPAVSETAIFAGGCFWGVEHHFQQVPGVTSVTSGYTGGTAANPTYEQVCTGRTGHAEAVRIVFDPERVSYEQLARRFFEIHDPTQRNRQGPDVGTQYRSAVFYQDDRQTAVAERLIGDLRARGYEVVTQVVQASTFYPAEGYHQDYLSKHPNRPTCHVRVPRFDKPESAP